MTDASYTRPSRKPIEATSSQAFARLAALVEARQATPAAELGEGMLDAPERTSGVKPLVPGGLALMSSLGCLRAASLASPR